MFSFNTYFDLLVHELRSFSQKNSWVYFVLLFCLAFIYFTGTGSIGEVLGVFLIYVAAEICMMTMITLIEEKNYIASSLFQLLGNIIFTGLFIYHFFHSGQYQYAIGSIGFILGALKNISKYHFHYSLSFIHGGSLFFFNILLFYLVYGVYGNITLQVLFQLI